MRRTLALTVLVLAVSVVGPVLPTAAADTPAVVMAEVAVPAAVDPPTGELATYAAAGWATSAPAATEPFAMVALELPDLVPPGAPGADPEGEVDVEVRVARGDGAWSDWTPLPHLHDEGPDPTSAEALRARPGHRTHPVFTGPADRLQVRTTGDPTDLRAHLIDPFGLHRSWARTVADRVTTAWQGSPASTAGALAADPGIVTRAEWGADEAIVTAEPVYADRVDRAFVHHTVGSNSYTQAQAPGIVRGIQAFHVNGNGWSDIGYNFLVDRFGTVFEGRVGGADQAVIGAQAGGFNTFSTGVALMGTFSNASAGPAALAAVERVVAWKADVHHFHPLRRGEATSMGSSRYPEGTVVELDNVSGHRDVSLTECPGGVTYGQLAALRTGVRQRAGDLIVDPASDVERTTVVRGDPEAESITFTGELDPPGEWALEVTDPDGDVVHRDRGSGGLVTSTMALPGDGWQIGEYAWALSAPGRRTAVRTVDLEPPVILGFATSADEVRVDRDGELLTALEVTAELWEDAAWTLSVRDGEGALVHRGTGVGERVRTTWEDGATGPGTYTVALSAEDALPVSREVEVRYDLFDRLGGADDAIGGATQISAATFEAGEAAHAVIARHDVFADALAGGPLAGGDGPLLFTASDRLDGRVTAELDRVLAPRATVYVLGGTAAIDDDVVDALADRYGRVERLAGPSRFATAAAIAAEVLERSGRTTALVARAGPDDAQPWADALAGGSWGAAAGVPVLLTDTGRMAPETLAAITDLGIRDTIVLGGAAAVADAVADVLPAPVRLAGDDRTATAVAIAERLWGPGVREVVVASAHAPDAWAWALAAAPVSARRGAPLLTTPGDALVFTVEGYLRATPSVRSGVVVGPTRLLSPVVAAEASDLIR